jgi:hypothetical protein
MTRTNAHEKNQFWQLQEAAVTCFSVSDMRKLGLPVSTPVKYLDDVSMPGAATASSK